MYKDRTLISFEVLQKKFLLNSTFRGRVESKKSILYILKYNAGSDLQRSEKIENMSKNPCKKNH